MANQTERFQVDLKGLIEVLGEHLYSSPDVFMRELLQNAVDAHTARRELDSAHTGWVRIEVSRSNDGQVTLIIEDNGIGLTSAEMKQFLATIGSSSKKDSLSHQRKDFLGQFGIGLLSCFMVSDEIVVVSQSARPNAQPAEWRGNSSGTYSVRSIRRKMSPGTRVYLRAKADSEETLEFDHIVNLARRYGEMLPFEITVSQKEAAVRINRDHQPWRLPDEPEDQAELAHYCYETFGYRPLDTIILQDDTCGLKGVGFVIPRPVALGTKNMNRLYCRGMFVTERATDLLPEWAFFLQCVINVDELPLTASREDFVRGDALEKASDALFRTLRNHLGGMARRSPDRFAELLSLHDTAMRALAVEDDEFFQTVIDILPFETSLGPTTLGEYRRENSVLRVAPTDNQFRQISTVAAAQSLCVFNGGFIYESELLHKAAAFFPELEWEAVSAADLVLEFTDLTEQEQAEHFDFLRRADQVLERFGCRVEMRRFKPESVPAIYASDLNAVLFREMGRSKDLADSHWGGILSEIQAACPEPRVEMCLNYDCPLVRQVAGMSDEGIQEHALQLLYLQALMLGQHPLSRSELELLGNSLGTLLSLAIQRAE